MAKNVLPTNFQDDILNANMNGRRRYKLIQNADGTVSLEDASAYDQVGSNFGAGQINATNTAVNASADAGKIIDNKDDIMANTQKGMLAGALALKEVNSNLGGNQLIYNESEDAYYIQNAGADTGLKKLGGKEVFVFRHIAPSAWVTYKTLYFSIAALYPEYNKLSIDNIFVQINALFANSSGSTSPFTYGYDASTGTVSMTMNRIDTSSAIGSSGYGTNADIIIII